MVAAGGCKCKLASEKKLANGTKLECDFGLACRSRLPIRSESQALALPDRKKGGPLLIIYVGISITVEHRGLSPHTPGLDTSEAILKSVAPPNP